MVLIVARVVSQTPLGIITISLDDSEVQRGALVLQEKFLQGLEEGLGQAGYAILRRAVFDVPTVPIDTGALRGSGSVHVDGKYRLDSSSWARTRVGRTGRVDVATPIRDDIPNEAATDEHIAVIGYNKVYAEETHEDTSKRFHEPGAGNY